MAWQEGGDRQAGRCGRQVGRQVVCGGGQVAGKDLNSIMCVCTFHQGKKRFSSPGIYIRKGIMLQFKMCLFTGPMQGGR